MHHNAVVTCSEIIPTRKFRGLFSLLYCFAATRRLLYTVQPPYPIPGTRCCLALPSFISRDFGCISACFTLRIIMFSAVRTHLSCRSCARMAAIPQRVRHLIGSNPNLIVTGILGLRLTENEGATGSPLVVSRSPGGLTAPWSDDMLCVSCNCIREHNVGVNRAREGLIPRIPHPVTEIY